MPRFFLPLFAILLSATALQAQRLSPLAEAPRWAELEAYQESMTREEFSQLLSEVYAPDCAAKDCISIADAAALVKTTLTPPATFTLRFAAAGAEKAVPAPWRGAGALGQAPAGKPLQGVKIALDPGHLGGTWARLEERYYQLGQSKPVQEGDLTLQVAKLLAPRLEALGAQVSFVRAAAEPVTPLRPENLRAQARAELLAEGHAKPRESYSGPDDPHRAGTVQLESELLFYRMAEIRQRARIVNEQLQPDLTVCLHFNAEAWGEPRHPDFVPRNHLHLIVNGCYSAAELRNDDLRFEMLAKLLSRTLPVERAASEAVAASLARATDLPPYTYTAPNAMALGDSGYVWARNLLANRLFHMPVIYLEPYVMNNELVWERVQLGDYDGEITIGGAARKSITREYADAVAEGLKNYFSQARASH